jgi:hypothetical protein
VAGIAIEGIRLNQLPLFFGLYNPKSSLAVLCWALYVALNYLYGRGNFDYYPESGEAPFDCGYRQGWVKNQHGNEVRVFYPVEKGSAGGKGERYPDVAFLEHGNKTLVGMALVGLGCRGTGWLGKIIFGNLRSIKIGVKQGAPLASKFKGRKIVPIFFSHGLTASIHLYSRLLRDLAMHGYLVIALNHRDGSCMFTVDSEKREHYHGPRQPLE